MDKPPMTDDAQLARTSVAEPSDTCVVDPRTIAQLRALDARRPGLFLRILGRYQQGARECVHAVAEALSNGDAATIRNLAHRLRGDSVSLGAARVVRCAQELEDRAQDHDLDAMTPAFQALEQAVQDALTELKALEAEAVQKGESPTTESGQA